MNVQKFIAQKRDGNRHSQEALHDFIQALPNIPDYQISAWLMAVYCRGLDIEETKDLTLAMVRSGDALQFPTSLGPILDKHSTGGVGDKTSLIIVPILAALGYKLCKLSGRGLGHSGGTIDKLESFTGFQHNLDLSAIKKQVVELGYIIAGQSASLAPADKILYALRDVTATVSCMPLIASSIMSKKIVSGCTALILDVKCGNGSFLKTEDEALALADLMKTIGEENNIKTDYIISSMDAPLGLSIGNMLEVEEAIQYLQGDAHDTLKNTCGKLIINLIKLIEPVRSPESILNAVEQVIEDGSALHKFKEMVLYQGGVWMDQFPPPPFNETIYTEHTGKIAALNAFEIAQMSLILGAGRIKKNTAVDLRAGIKMKVHLGSTVHSGDPIMELYSSDPQKLKQAVEYYLKHKIDIIQFV